MKLMLALLLLVSSSMAFASSGIDASYNGNEITHNIDLRNDVYRTEYRDEYVWDTCYDRVCRQVPRRVCDHNGRCRTRYERRCHTRSYSCQRYRRVAYQVYDHTEVANIDLLILGLDDVLNQDANVYVRFNREVSFSSKDKEVLFYLEEQTSRNAGNYTKEVNATLKPVLAAKAFSPARQEITNAKVENGVFSFEIGKVHHPEFFKLKLVIKRTRALGSKTLFDRDLAMNEAQFVDMGNKTLVSIDVHQFGIEYKEGKKHRFLASAIVEIPGEKLVNSKVKLSEDTGVKVKTRM